ncbi:hypothetical protein [Paenibacillus alvei]|uniref:hypothetical protein n=1 Tax=Paenibacillus alvei TaxID=44250 RepID=UPI000289F1E8|nr:hypothetical protein [Paenibacillus alvei]EJW14731.1 hypothetical protein PAV_11c00720 [Paenibacillus alvei DSM 29]MCY9540928.1 hypothetical protein [Paenibacillus alvei]MCY9708168.1 hypothetical protein [Paenibacillus alvei]MEC0080199.1 hypothetical protein [Paenibacillus alvei]NEZ43318.1 hypothetical protein [Paenibacillus alvei]
MLQRYKKNVYIDVVEFTNTPENHKAIIDFAGLPISVEYTSGGVQLRVIRGAYSVLVAKLGECIVKEADGSLRVCTKEALADEGYTLVE